jgi:type VI secretion system protein ImpH
VIEILRNYLQVPVTLEPLRGAWRALDAAQHAKLGRANCRLGVDSVVGTRVWDEQARVRIVAGPMDYERFRRLLPEDEGGAYVKLAALIRFLLDRRFDCELRLLVRTDTLPRTSLGDLRLARRGWLTGRLQGNPEDRPGAPDAVRRVDLLVPAFAEAP